MTFTQLELFSKNLSHTACQTEDSSDSASVFQPTGHIFGIGASAGGLEAIESFFKEIPADSGFTLIAIQHLSPDYKSLMVELLSKNTQMKVLSAEDGMNVEPNHIYLIPPQKNMTIIHPCWWYHLIVESMTLTKS